MDVLLDRWRITQENDRRVVRVMFRGFHETLIVIGELFDSVQGDELMRKVLTVKQLAFLGLTVAVAMILASQDQAEARPKYFIGFAKAYPSVAAQAKKVKCGVCHYGKSKKNRNDYGKALMKNVKKNAKDAKVIAAAFAPEVVKVIGDIFQG